MKMISIHPCRACERPLIRHRVANLDVKIEPSPLDGQEAVAEIIAGRNLWMVDARTNKPRPAVPGEAGPLKEHRCTVVGREAAFAAPWEPAKAATVRPKASSPSAGPSRPSSGRSGGNPPDATSAGPSLSDQGPVCDTCSKPMDDGTYASIEVGDLVVWANHVDAKECTP